MRSQNTWGRILSDIYQWKDSQKYIFVIESEQIFLGSTIWDPDKGELRDWPLHGLSNGKLPNTYRLLTVQTHEIVIRH